MKNKYYTWFVSRTKDWEEYSYLVPIPRGSEVLGGYVNHSLDTPIGVSMEFWSVEQAPELSASSHESPPKKDLIKVQRELIAGVFVNG